MTFSLKPDSDILIIDDIAKCENHPISFLNQIDRTFPKNWTYIKTCILKNNYIEEEYWSIPIPCNCEDSCDANCTCVKLLGEPAYISGKLSQNYDNHLGKPIFECSNMCECQSETCSNRVVQNGIQFSLRVSKTLDKGFGLYAKELIPKCSYVCEYAGEIIDAKEAEKRVKRMKPDDPNYIYVLKEHFSQDSCVKTIIDPTFFGNVGRFLNHSCTPNLISIPVRTNSMVPRICFFAKVDILPEEELTYDYGGELPNATLSCHEKNSLVKSARKCLCNSPECRGLLPFTLEWLE